MNVNRDKENKNDNKFVEVTKDMTKTSKDALKILWNRGNVWAVAIGMLIGGALGAVVNSFANDIIVSGIASAFGIRDVNDWIIGGMRLGKFFGSIVALIIIFFTMWAGITVWIYLWNKTIVKLQKNKPTAHDDIQVVELEKRIVHEIDLLSGHIKSLEKMMSDIQKSKTQDKT